MEKEIVAGPEGQAGQGYTQTHRGQKSTVKEASPDN